MPYKPMPNSERLRALLHYDLATGEFTRAVTTAPRAKAGAIAGGERKDGYRRICVDGTDYFAHRLAWLYVTGTVPDGEIDHINGNPRDNRIANLRCVTHGQNTLNSRQRPPGVSGLRGVTLHKKTGLWNARIRIDGKQSSLGYFKSPEQAKAAYEAAVLEVHGEHAYSKGVGA